MIIEDKECGNAHWILSSAVLSVLDHSIYLRRHVYHDRDMRNLNYRRHTLGALLQASEYDVLAAEFLNIRCRARNVSTISAAFFGGGKQPAFLEAKQWEATAPGSDCSSSPPVITIFRGIWAWPSLQKQRKRRSWSSRIPIAWGRQEVGMTISMGLIVRNKRMH